MYHIPEIIYMKPVEAFYILCYVILCLPLLMLNLFLGIFFNFTDILRDIYFVDI